MQPVAIKTVRVRIFGRVQGVFFRHHTKLMAEGLGLSGWVRNCTDGSVEAVCSGSAERVDQMIDWLHLGPDSAVVSRVDTVSADDLPPPRTNFTIRH